MRKSFLASALALGVGIALSAYGQASVANGAAEAQASSANVESVAATSELDWDAAPEPGTLKTVTVDGIAYNFRYCPTGSFTMGSPASEEGRGELEDQHTVRISTGFWTLETEVTVAMYRSFVKATGHKTESAELLEGKTSSWDDPGLPVELTDDMPVTMVSWNDAVAFCKWLSEETGATIRLPKEAEWEYACRAGTKGGYNYVGSVTTTDVETSREQVWKFNYGRSMPFKPGEKEVEYTTRTYDRGRYRVTEVTKKTKQARLDNAMEDQVPFWAQVKKFRSNTWHIYEMHGNVREWCADNFTLLELMNLPRGDEDPENEQKQTRVAPARGGSWASHVDDCRSASRDFLGMDYRDFFTGFRCVAEGKSADAAPETNVSNASSEDAPKTNASDASSEDAPKTNASDASSEDAPKTNVSSENSDAAWDANPAAGTRKVLTVDGVEYAFRYCPAGTFTMGSPESESGRDDDETQHEVTLDGFWLLETEVTQAMWKSVMGSNPSNFKSSERNPVERVNWGDCQDFIKKLNSLGVAPNGFEFRLPSEAEWEYACRAGSDTAYFWGNSLNGDKANCIGHFPYGTSTKGEYLERTTRVGSYAPNAWGLYDMHGNVWEWCADWYDSNYYEKSNNVQNPINVTAGSNRVLRGGSWFHGAKYCRSASRTLGDPTYRGISYGFRLVLGRAVDAAAPVEDAVEDEIELAEDDKQSSQEPETDASDASAEDAPKTDASDASAEDAPKTDASDASAEDAPKTDASDENFDVAWDAEPKAGTRKTLTVGGVEYAFRYCPAGTFQMGSPTNEVGRLDNETQHRVTLDGFWMLETEVTVGMWRSFVKATGYKMGSGYNGQGGFSYNASTRDFEFGSQYTWDNPGFPQTDAHPVTEVDWAGAKAFCDWLSKESGLPIRLPSEAEWEYACRAGSTTAYSFGSNVEDLTKYGNVADASAKRELPSSLTKYWSFVSSDDGCVFTAPVKQFKPNAWNLYDMHGNVFEWCADWYAGDYYKKQNNARNPINVTPDSSRVLRGGSWSNNAESCRSAYRYGYDPTTRHSRYGFRLALVRAVDAAAPVEDAVEDEIELAEDDKQSSQEPKTDLSAAIQTALSDKKSNVAPKTDASGENSEDAPKTDASDENSDVAWDAASDAGTLKTLTVEGVEYAFRYCPAGTFTMGSPADESGRDDDETQHGVTLTNGFWMLETEVTQAMWKSLMGENPSYFCSSGNGSSWVSGRDTSNFPVEQVSWNGCQDFIKKLNSLGVAPNGFEFRLPSEAEWEYACRAGSDTAYFWGDSLNGDKANCNGNYPCGTSTKGKYLEHTMKVGRYAANAWGLHDMHGNVFEWCEDWYDANYYEKSNNALNPINVTPGSDRVLRGGCWFGLAENCRSACRFSSDPTSRFSHYGFRLALVRAVDAATPVGDAVEGEIKFEEDDKQSSQEAEADVSAAIQTALSDKKSNVAPETDASGENSEDAPKTDASDENSEDAPKTDASDENSDVAWDAASEAGTLKTLTVDGITYNFRYCPAGTFTMGSPASESGRYDGETQHRVELTTGFWMLETEVMQAMWQAVMGTNPSRFTSSERNPVENVNWNDCQEFIAKLNALGVAPAGLKFRLPTEAEWEYACRAGTTGPYAGSSLDELGWYTSNSGGRTHEVGTKTANAWGLHDMHGNVWEWCEDKYAAYEVSENVQNPINATLGSNRVLRGGGWSYGAKDCRSAFRNSFAPTGRFSSCGFRLALVRAVDAAAPVEDADENSDVAWEAASEAGTLKTLTVDGITYNFRYCPAGTFQMGSPTSESGRYAEETQHEVTLDGFWMLETEVTVGMWRSFVKATGYKLGSGYCGLGGFGYNASTGEFEFGSQYTWDNPGFPQTDAHPVTEVDWAGAVAFCVWLSKETGAPIRLPSEAEWEYACRAGSTTAYSFGSNVEDLTKYGNVADASAKRELPSSVTQYWDLVSSDDGYVFTAPVKQFKPNAWNLYDMHGNVWERCADWYAGDYYKKQDNAQNPINVTPGSNRVLRGGGWNFNAESCRSASRSNGDPTVRDCLCGFRLALGRAVDAAKTNVSSKDSDVAWDAEPKAGTRKTLTVDGVKYAFRYCPAGTFTMGSPASESDRAANETQYHVTLTTGFWMLETEVTQTMWKSLMCENPSYFCSSGGGSSEVSGLDTSNFPVEDVNWNDCQEFIAKLNALGVAPAGLKFRLPTEAEWEYACRAWMPGPYAGSSLDELGWYAGNSGGRTHEVGTKTPNVWGLHDMHGNVWEWCEYDRDNSARNSIDEALRAFRMFRGGSWCNIAEDCRSARRCASDWTSQNGHIGFRLVLGREL